MAGRILRPARRLSRSELRPARWSLRLRVLALLLAVLAAVGTGVGVVGVLALDRFLTERLDTQLVAAVSRAGRAVDPPAGGREAPGYGKPGGLGAPGQGEGTLGADLDDGAVTAAAVLGRDGTPSVVPDAVTDVLDAVRTDGSVQTVELAGLGEYRVVGRADAGGDGFLTGLPLAPVQQTVTQLAVVVAAVLLVALAVAAAVGARIVRLALRPLNRVAATASRVAELPLDRGEVALAERVPADDADDRTEVGKVGVALNRMLEHVARALSARQASEARVRRFVADASHELRTPLASIRGYAELTRRSGGRLPPDVGYAIGRVEAEATRMTALVEDLLLLARLDEGRPMQRAPVELSDVVVAAVNDAHAAGPQHRWLLQLPDEPVTVLGDGARLHQVLANLLANARSHTPPGSTVRASLDLDPAGDVVLAVGDDGPGIPADLLPDVFGRFTRGDSSRSRAAGSTGLGLAIVSAVVAAHHGTVEVRSVPGSTTFTVRLPAASPHQALSEIGVPG